MSILKSSSYPQDRWLKEFHILDLHSTYNGQTHHPRIFHASGLSTDEGSSGSMKNKCTTLLYTQSFKTVHANNNTPTVITSYYGQRLREIAQNGIYVIDKLSFLSKYIKIHAHASSKANILSGFAAAGFISNRREFLQKLYIKLKTPTPPSLSNNQSFYLGRTPGNLYKLNKQKKQIQVLQNQPLFSVITDQVLEKFMKSRSYNAGCCPIETRIQSASHLK